MWFPYTLTFLGLGVAQLVARGVHAWLSDTSTVMTGVTTLFWMLIIGLLVDGFVSLRERLRSRRGMRMRQWMTWTGWR